MGIYGANVFAEDGIFEVGSRFNHACIPNVYISRDPGLTKSTFHTTRDIEVGEELTVSYVLELDTEPRNASHFELWGFVCACHVCSGPDRFALQRKRREIVELQRKNTMKGNVGLLDLMDRLRKAAELLVSIGLEGDNLQHLCVLQFSTSGYTYHGMFKVRTDGIDHWTFTFLQHRCARYVDEEAAGSTDRLQRREPSISCYGSRSAEQVRRSG